MGKSPLQASVYENPPRKHVLLLTCMDQRLLDNTVEFMNELNLQNRYDHLIFAGAAMGAGQLKTSVNGVDLPWKSVFFHHLTVAINDLHREIHDIFLVEHLDCGAYKKLHPDTKIRKQYSRQTDLSKLKKYHRHEALTFKSELEQFCAQQATLGISVETWEAIRVHCFVMDLLGEVEEFA